MIQLNLLVTTLGLVGLVVSALSAIYAWTFWRPKIPMNNSASWPAVSLLKPLKGHEPGLDQNLESYFLLDYPSYEILFCVADLHDPALAIAERLMAAYPKVPVRLFQGGHPARLNPKVMNMLRAYDEATNDIIVISDANTRVDPSHLKRIVPHLTDEVGVVTSVVSGRHVASWGGELESAMLGTFCARWMLTARAAGVGFVVGKSMAFRRSLLDQHGGLRRLSPMIAEDYQCGEILQSAGYRVEVSSEPIHQIIGDYSFSSFWNRHVRWGRIRKSQAPYCFALESIQGAIPSSLMCAWGLHGWLSQPLALTFSLFLLAWLSADLLLRCRVDGRSSLHLRPITAWFLRELLHLPLWTHAAAGSSVLWHGHNFRLRRGGVVANASRSAGGRFHGGASPAWTPTGVRST